MEFIKKSYYYFFYKIYKAIQYTSEPFGEFLTEYKAGLVLIALEIWTLMSLGAYYAVVTKTFINLSISMPIVYIPLIIIFGFNYYTVDYLQVWKKYNQEFDKLPKQKNKIGSWIVFLVIIFIITFFIYSIYLMSQIDWSQYK